MVTRNATPVWIDPLEDIFVYKLLADWGWLIPGIPALARRLVIRRAMHFQTKEDVPHVFVLPIPVVL